MALTLSGTTGVAGVDGSAGTPAVQGSDTNTGISFGTDTVSINTGGTARATVDSSGRLGIGTTSPSGTLHVSQNLNSAGDCVFENTSTGSSASAAVRYKNSGSTLAYSGLAGASRTTYATLGPNVGVVYYTDNNAGATILVDAAGPITFGTNAAERARIDSSGRLLVGTTSARTDLMGAGAQLQVEGTTFATARLGVAMNANNAEGGNIYLVKSRGASAGGVTVVSSGDTLGDIEFGGADGTNIDIAARIRCQVDGTPGANNMPGKLVFSTTPSGTASVQEKFSISQDGRAELPNCIYFRPTDNATNLGTATNRWAVVYAVNGTINTSDGRQKTDISTSSLGTDFVKALRPVSYKWIEGGKVKTGKFDEDGNNIYEAVPGKRTHWGFIAQEVKQAVDAAGVDFGGWVLDDLDDPDSQQSLRYDQFIAPLTKALQEALEKIESLEARLTTLEGGTN